MVFGGVVGLEVPGMIGGAGRVMNLPTVLIGGVLFLAGIILFSLADSSPSVSERSVATPTFVGEANLTNDSYKIFLTKQYRIERNQALEQFECDGKLFDNAKTALEHAHDLYLDFKKSQASYECPKCRGSLGPGPVEKIVQCWGCGLRFWQGWIPQRRNPHTA